MESLEKEDWRKKCERYVDHVQSQHKDSPATVITARPSQEAFATRDGGGACHHEIRSAFLLSSVHGIPYAARAKNPCAKGIWITLVLGVLGCLAYFIYLLVLRYLHFGFTSVRHFKSSLPVDHFPAVTVCNANLLKRTKVENSRFKTILDKMTGEFVYRNDTQLDTPLIDVTEYLSLFTLLKQNGITDPVPFLNLLDRLQFVEKGSLPSREDLLRIYADTHDMGLVWWALDLKQTEVQALGHTLKQMIIQCYFNGRRCRIGSQYFTTLHDIRFGNCFTFLLDKPEGNVYFPTDTGLELTFDIKLNEYLGLFNDVVGLRIFIHQSGTSFFDYPEYSASPGMMTSLTITETCVSGAIAAKTEATCRCSLPSKNSSLTRCRTSNQFQYVCSDAVRTLYASGKLQTECKPSCRDISYNIETSQQVWPSSVGANFTREELKATIGLDISNEYLKENIGRLRVSYLDQYIRVQEEQEEFLIFLTHVGGATSLLLGISAMTLIELVYIFFEAIWWAVTSCRRRPETRIEYLRPSGEDSVISSFGQGIKRPPSTANKNESPNFNWKLQPRANVYLPTVDPEDIKIYDTATSTLYRQAWDDANARFSETAQPPNVLNSVVDQTSFLPGTSNDITWYYRKPQEEAEMRKTAKIISELAADKKNHLDAKKVYF